MLPRFDLDRLSPADLKALVITLLEKIAALEHTVAAQREEIARLKGLKGPPPMKPSGMEQASGDVPAKGAGRKRRRKGRGAAALTAHEERIVKAEVPAGSRFKGYEDFLVQDVIVRAHVVRYRRERWLTPDGHTVIAPLPAGVAGHCGADLRRYVLALYHQGQLTVPRLVEHLAVLGLQVSKRQVVRILTDQGPFLSEAEAVLRAGLRTARWISVDDTGARHKAANGVCTQIGDDRFTAFATTSSKSRLNFLELLRAGHRDYVINAEALTYLRRRALPQHAIARLSAHPCKHFPDEEAWRGHLHELGFHTIEHSLDPLRLATEGALWGSIKEHGFLADTVILSDDAGQFMVGEHALCWVHAERLVHKLDTFTDADRAAQAKTRALIWWFYRDLKAYCREPTARRRIELRARFDRIFKRRTGFVMLDRLLARLHANKAELLMALERPEVPLHTNSSENDIRCQVTRRKISCGTRSNAGRDCRDAFLALMKTCRKLGLSFWDYLGARLGAVGTPAVPYLPDVVIARGVPP
jgi:Transposase IS66 family